MRAWLPLEEGGELVLADVRGRKRRRLRTVPAEPRDCALYCSPERLDQVGGVYGRQPVAYGFGTGGAERLRALLLPFHDEF